MIPVLAQAASETAQMIDLFSALLTKLGIPGTVILVIVLGIRKFIIWSKPYIEGCFDAFQKRQERIADSHENMANKTIEIQMESMSIHRQNANTLERNTDLLERIEKGIPNVCQKPDPQQPKRGLGG